MNFDKVIIEAAELGASDVHIAVGDPPVMRVSGELVQMPYPPLTHEAIRGVVSAILTETQQKTFKQTGHIDSAYLPEGQYAFRINIFYASGRIGMALRIISNDIPTPEALLLPEAVRKVAALKSGLVLVTGPTGCGKSTTIASLLSVINETKRCHILTIEDPIEYTHRNKMSLVTQREIGRDCDNFSEALRAGLRQDPDVIMVGELRDLETISTAVTAAETGHLVLATLHTRTAHQTIERIIDVFPAHHQQQIRVQLASSLMAVFSQRLLPKRQAPGRIVAVESLIVTPAVRNLIRESKVHQLQTFIQTGQKMGMQTMDAYLMELYRAHHISKVTALENAVDQENIHKLLG
ncbi:type IV pilus twitching motility protein PilT [Fusibacter sp. JL298sf-3]